MQKYKTKDIFEASWILSQVKALSDLEPAAGYFFFVFEDFNKCKALSQEYWNSKAVGDIKEFVNSYRMLKDMVFSR